MKDNINRSRRQALKQLGKLGGLAALTSFGGLTGCAKIHKRFAQGEERKDFLKSFSPIDRTLGNEPLAPRFFGDAPENVHPVLWATGKSAPTAPAAKEKTDLVVIGGGMSGLASAYLLRHWKPIVLEQAPRFGGNAKGQEWEGIPYSIGAAYLMVPDTGSALEKFYQEIGVDKLWREASETTTMALTPGNKWVRNFWKYACESEDETLAVAAKNLETHFLDVLNERNGWIYPEVPYANLSAKQSYEKLDRISYYDHLRQVHAKVSSKPIPDFLMNALESYCWTSWGASSTEISAAAGLNFYASEFSSVGVCPGGNPKVAETLLERLSKSVPMENLRASSLVYSVERKKEGVLVSYRDSAGGFRSILARKVIFSCPKFVVGRILKGLDAGLLASYRQIEYRSYLVGSALLKGVPNEKDFYEAFFLNKGRFDLQNIRKSAKEQKVTDIILANYGAQGKNGSLKISDERAVFNLYRALPYTGARPELLAADIKNLREEFFAQLRDEILPVMGMKASQLVDLRVARWGHPLPVPKPGFAHTGLYEKLRSNIGNELFFIEQDNWCIPAIEIALGEALALTPDVEKALKS